MRITDIKPLPVWVGNRNQLVVKVETDAGIFGLGESGLTSALPRPPLSVSVCPRARSTF